jgi:8-oxo-dGTP pyrophosphatase MutT (NUDIX family)
LKGVPVDPPGVHERRAAVLILLYDRHDAPHLVLTKRTDTLAHHPGQISLPGGRWETVDGDLGTTALRETQEELGVASESVRLVGRLGDELTMVSGFVVAPYVGVAAETLHPVPCEREIARVLEVPLAELLAADDALPEAPDIVTLRYPLLDEDVWGATARILHAFSGVVRTALQSSDARH